MSGETDKNKINEFYKAGAAKFIIKPFTKVDLNRIIQFNLYPSISSLPTKFYFNEYNFHHGVLGEAWCS